MAASRHLGFGETGASMENSGTRGGGVWGGGLPPLQEIIQLVQLIIIIQLIQLTQNNTINTVNTISSGIA